MCRAVVFYLCACAIVSVTDGKPWARKGQKARGTSGLAVAVADAPAADNGSQCLVKGMYLFEGAEWSPEPCSICRCQNGSSSCHSAPCINAAPQTPQSSAHRARGQPRRAAVKEGDKARGKSAKRDNGSSRLQQVAVSPVGKNLVEIKYKKQETGSVSVKELTKRAPILGRKKEAGAKVEAKVGKVLKETLSSGAGTDSVMKETKKAQKEKKKPKKKEEDEDEEEDDDEDDEDESDEKEEKEKDKDKEEESESKTTPPPERFPSTSFLNRTNFMESLPAGCLLSDSLIACGSVGMAHLPIITDLGVKTLYLADNKISKLPFRGLSGLPNLEWLDLSKNKLEDSSLSRGVFRNLTELKRLNLDGNSLNKIPLLPPSLEELKINDNKIKSLTPHSFKGLFKLLTLELEGNGFHDGNVSPLTFRPLRSIIYLRLDRNKFRAVPSGLPPSLQELHLSVNRVEEVHEGILNKTLQLKVLDLSHNRIREDRIAPRAWIHLPKLEALDLSNNKLVHVPSFLPMALRQLTLHHNQIERIPGYVFGHLQPGLESLHLSHNRLMDDGIDGVSFLGLYHTLSELLLDHNRLRSIPRGLLLLKSLQLLRLNHNSIRYIPMDSICDTRVSEDSPLVSVHLENNLIDRRLIPPTALSCIKTYHSVILRPQAHEEEE